MEEYHNHFEQDRDKLATESVENQARMFLEYASRVIEAKEEGKVSLQEAAYAIADTMFLPGVDSDGRLEAITLLAGELELPESHISGDPEQKWMQLKAWVQEEVDTRN